MVIYETNSTINNEIYDGYYKWLVEHIEIMLQFRGFQKAEITKEKDDGSQKTKLTIRYTLDSEQDLDDYIKNHAPEMRKSAVDKFGDKYTVVARRIFETSTVIIRKPSFQNNNEIDINRNETPPRPPSPLKLFDVQPLDSGNTSMQDISNKGHAIPTSTYTQKL